MVTRLDNIIFAVLLVLALLVGLVYLPSLIAAEASYHCQRVGYDAAWPHPAGGFECAKQLGFEVLTAPVPWPR